MKKKIIALTLAVCGLLLLRSHGSEAQTAPEPPGVLFPAAQVTPPPRIPPEVRLLERGYLNYRQGRLKEAEQAYTQLIQTRGLSRNQRATAYLLRGEVRRDLNQLDGALEDFTRALRQWPNYTQALFFRAQLYEHQELLVEALADFNRAAELAPDRNDCQNRLTLIKNKMAAQGWVLQENQPPLPLDRQGSPPDGPDDDLKKH